MEQGAFVAPGSIHSPTEHPHPIEHPHQSLPERRGTKQRPLSRAVCEEEAAPMGVRDPSVGAHLQAVAVVQQGAGGAVAALLAPPGEAGDAAGEVGTAVGAALALLALTVQPSRWAARLCARMGLSVGCTQGGSRSLRTPPLLHPLQLWLMCRDTVCGCQPILCMPCHPTHHITHPPGANLSNQIHPEDPNPPYTPQILPPTPCHPVPPHVPSATVYNPVPPHPTCATPCTLRRSTCPLPPHATL